MLEEEVDGLGSAGVEVKVLRSCAWRNEFACLWAELGIACCECRQTQNALHVCDKASSYWIHGFEIASVGPLPWREGKFMKSSWMADEAG